MPVRNDPHREQTGAREEDDLAARAARRKRWLITFAVCLVWIALGLGMVVWALATPMKREHALEVMTSAPGIAAAGVLLTVLISRVLAERAGEA